MARQLTRPLTRYAQQQNAAFLHALRQSGNVVLAARTVGLNPATFYKRRYRYPAFAAEWDGAVVIALADGTLGPPSRGRAAAGAEPSIVTLKSGRRQLRRARAGQLDHAGRQRFLFALAASANVLLSAAAAGFSPRAFYYARRHDPAFAREMRLALQAGYERLECALIESWSERSVAHEDWAVNELPALPPMTPAQALQLLYLHQKEARLLAEPAHIRKRRGESPEAHGYRLSAMYEARQERDREAYRRAEIERQLRPRAFAEPPAPAIPDLAQVTGWSKADPAQPAHGDAALFGGWRIEHLTPEQVEKGRVTRAAAGRSGKTEGSGGRKRRGQN